MEMKIVRESVEADRLIAAGSEQAVVEGEVALPGSMRDAAHVLNTDAKLILGAVEPQADRLALDGQVVFHVLYTQGDPTRVQALEAACDFSHQMEMEGVGARMHPQLTGEVVEASASASGGRLLLRAIVSLASQVFSEAPIPVVRDITGMPVLRTRAQEVSLARTVGEGQAESLLREEFELPKALGVVETLYANAQPQVSEVIGGEGRATVSGTVLLDVYHATNLPELPLTVTHHEMAFEQPVDLTGQPGQSLHAQCLVRDVMVNSMDAGDGERVLRAEVVLGTRTKATTQTQQALLTDAYTLSGPDVALTRVPMALHTQDIHASARETGKLLMQLPERSKPVGTVLTAFVRPSIVTRERIGGRLTLGGILAVTVIYLPQEANTPVSAQKDEPFTMTFPSTLPVDAQMQLIPLEVEAVGITSDRVELRYMLQLAGQMTLTEPVEVVADARAQETLPQRGGVVLYYPQTGETLWDVARRYRVDEQSLLKMNPGLDQAKGDKSILIYQRGEVAQA